jgi:hypothetical protein
MTSLRSVVVVEPVRPQQRDNNRGKQFACEVRVATPLPSAQLPSPFLDFLRFPALHGSARSSNLARKSPVSGRGLIPLGGPVS